jgi:hypothetical protein
VEKLLNGSLDLRVEHLTALARLLRIPLGERGIYELLAGLRSPVFRVSHEYFRVLLDEGLISLLVEKRHPLPRCRQLDCLDEAERHQQQFQTAAGTFGAADQQATAQVFELGLWAPGDEFVEPDWHGLQPDRGAKGSESQRNSPGSPLAF